MQNSISSKVIFSFLLLLIPLQLAQAQEEEEEFLLRETEREFRHGLIDAETTIEVLSRRSESARQAMGVITVINRREIELFGANNLYEVLDRVVASYSLGSLLFSRNQMSMRGDVNGNFSNRIAVLLNGRPTWGSASEGVDYVMMLSLPLEIVERIEIHRGPGSLYHGSAAFIGAINIVTKRPYESHEITASAGGGSNDALFTSWAGGISNIGGKQNPRRDERISAYGGLRYYDETGYPVTLYNPLSTGEPSLEYDMFYKVQSGFLELDYKGLRINALFARSQITTIDDPLLGEQTPETMDADKYYLNIGYYKRFSEGWSVNVNAGYIKDTASVDNLSENEGFIVEQQGDLEIIDSEDFIFEGSLNGNLLENLQFTVGSEVKYISGGEAQYSFLRSYQDWVWRGYMDARYSLTSYFHLFAGLQLQDFEDLDADILTPKIGLMLDILPSTSLKLLYGYATRDPSKIESRLIFNQRVGAIGRPERIRTFETQLSSRFEDVHFSATYFYSRYLDQIVPVVEDIYFLGWENDDLEMTTLGFEIEAQYAALENFYINTSYGYVENRRLTETPGLVEIGFTHAPTYFFKAGVAYFIPRKFNIGLFASYYSKPKAIDTLIEDSSNPVPGEYTWMTLKADWHITSSLKLGLYLTNLTDEEVRWPDSANNILNSIPGKGGRSAYLTATFRLGEFY